MKKLPKIFKSDKTSSFNLKPMENLNSTDLHQMIRSKTFPAFLEQKDKDRITELYEKGEQFNAVRKLKGIIENQSMRPGKTLL